MTTDEDAVLDLLDRSWESIEAIEFAGYLLFPDKIYRRRSGGNFEAKNVYLRVPRPNEMRKARLQSRKLALAEGMDTVLDADMIENLENMCIMSVAIRNDTDPHEPWEPDPLALESEWDHASLTRVWAKLESLNRVIDPRPDQISEPQMLAVIAKISKERHIGPLVVFGLDSQASCMIYMADRVMSCLESKSSSAPSESSTPDS